MKARAVIARIARFTMVALVVAAPMRKAIAQTSSEYFTWGVDANSSFLNPGQGGSIELGQPYPGTGANPVSGGVPYMDFHYGNGESQDYNYRIINSANNILDFESINTNPLRLELNSIQVNGGVDATGTGIKHVRTGASCTATSGIGHTCAIVVDWPGSGFADANYTATCNVKSVSWGSGSDVAAYSLLIQDANKAPTSLSVIVENLSNAGSITVAGLNCIAIHD